MRRLLLVLLALLTCLPATASADLDPASDWLAATDSYPPQSPKAKTELTDRLKLVSGTANVTWQPYRVAVIANKLDLGGVPQFVGQPAGYATFLNAELADANNFGGLLLVVMPEGYGVAGAYTPAVGDLVKTLPKPRSAAADDLVQAAVDATIALAGADGKDLAAGLSASTATADQSTAATTHGASPEAAATAPGSTDHTAVILLALAGVLGLAGVGILVASRRRRADEVAPGEPESANADAHSATVDPGDTEADPDSATVDPGDADADPDSANADPGGEDADPGDADADPGTEDGRGTG